MHIRTVHGETPNIVNTQVVSARRYLTGGEVEKLMEAARKPGRYGHRDATMILLAYRHGLRASELCDLQWHQVEINTGRLHVRRSKKGTPSVHPMQGDEIRALRRLQREQEASPYVFTSERGGPMSAKSFGTLFERLGKRAGMPFTIFPHMLRHAVATPQGEERLAESRPGFALGAEFADKAGMAAASHSRSQHEQPDRRAGVSRSLPSKDTCRGVSPPWP